MYETIIISIISLGTIAAIFDILPGYIYFKNRFVKRYVRYFVAFAAGTVLGTVFFELLPESNVESNFYFVAIGFLVFYTIEKLIILHSCGEPECETHEVSSISVVGMASDNILDGVALGVGYLINPSLGFLLLFAIVVHEIPQGITSAQIMKETGYNEKKIYVFLIFAGLMYVLGSVISLFIPKEYFIYAIAFVAGIFLYIGTSDLLMEAHKKFNIHVINIVIIGVVIVALLEFFI